MLSCLQASGKDIGRLVLRLGPCRVRVEFCGPEIQLKAQQFFGGFVCSGSEAAEDFSIELLPEPSDCAGPPAGYQRKILENGFLLESGFFRAEADLGTRRAWIRGLAFPESLQVLLRNLLPWLASPGLVVHGALLHLETGVVACCGPSGAGKSTLACLANANALCDELALIRREGDAFFGFSLPFWRSTPGAGPLRGILMLSHSPVNRLKRIHPSQAVRDLAAQVLWPTYSSPAMAAGFQTLMALVQEVPVYSFGFRPEPSAVSYLNAAFPPETE